MEQLTNEQRTYDWYRARFGKFTASQVHKLMGKTDLNKSKDGKEVFGDTAMSYIYQLASERKLMMNGTWDAMDDEQKDEFIRTQYPSNKAMQWGTEHEADARIKFSFVTGKAVKEVGTCINQAMPNVSASPDGVIEEENALIEIKCPSIEIFARYTDTICGNESLLEEKPEYYWQIQLQMWVTGMKKCYFVWYHPLLGLKHTTIDADRGIEQLELRIRAAEEIVQRAYTKL